MVDFELPQARYLKEFAPKIVTEHNTPVTSAEFESRIDRWARQQDDISALIQIGSRAQGGLNFDEYSDWDFHLISSRPEKYHGVDWLRGIATPWSANSEKSQRGFVKVSAVFEGGWEVDFVPLKSWQIKTVYWAMRHPDWSTWLPLRLRRGVLEMREILLNSGYRIWVGEESWKERLRALEVYWPPKQMAADEFARHTAAFWQKSVWVAKKIFRPEPRSAMHWMHKLVLDHVYALLEEEAWRAGRKARPEALKAEKWLDPRRLHQTGIVTKVDQSELAKSLLSVVELFEEVSQSVAETRKFQCEDYSALSAWLKSELRKRISKN